MVPTVISPSTVSRARLRTTPVSAFTATVAVLSIRSPESAYSLMPAARIESAAAWPVVYQPVHFFTMYQAVQSVNERGQS